MSPPSAFLPPSAIVLQVSTPVPHTASDMDLYLRLVDGGADEVLVTCGADTTVGDVSAQAMAKFNLDEAPMLAQADGTPLGETSCNLGNAGVCGGDTVSVRASGRQYALHKLCSLDFWPSAPTGNPGSSVLTPAQNMFANSRLKVLLPSFSDGSIGPEDSQILDLLLAAHGRCVRWNMPPSTSAQYSIATLKRLHDSGMNLTWLCNLAYLDSFVAVSRFSAEEEAERAALILGMQQCPLRQPPYWQHGRVRAMLCTAAAHNPEWCAAMLTLYPTTTAGLLARPDEWTPLLAAGPSVARAVAGALQAVQSSRLPHGRELCTRAMVEGLARVPATLAGLLRDGLLSQQALSQIACFAADEGLEESLANVLQAAPQTARDDAAADGGGGGGVSGASEPLLHRAAKSRSLASVRLVLDAGADPHCLNAFGRRAVCWAMPEANPPALWSARQRAEARAIRAALVTAGSVGGEEEEEAAEVSRVKVPAKRKSKPKLETTVKAAVKAAVAEEKARQREVAERARVRKKEAAEKAKEARAARAKVKAEATNKKR